MLVDFTPRVITGPTYEPVTVAEVQAALRLDILTAGEDDLLETYIAATRKYIENVCSMTVHEQTLEIALDCWPGCSHVELPRATPLIEIVSVIYKDSDGNSTTWDDADYIADTDSVPGRLVLGYNKSWPSFTAWPVSPIRIRYKAGIDNALSPLPEADPTIKTACLLGVGGLWENRESEVLPERPAQAMIANPALDRFIAMNVKSYAF